jgi:hypothetical protein
MSWGPWIEHDGTANCPSNVYLGAKLMVRGVFAGKPFSKELAVCSRCLLGSSWGGFDQSYGATAILSYRIHKPRGMEVLEAILADLPAPSKQGADA